jgi:hypothetical protein
VGELPAYLAQELAAAAYYREGEEDSNSLHQDSYVLYDPNPPFLEGEAWQRHVAERYGTSIDIPLHQVASILGESSGFDERILENLVEQEQESSSLPSFKVPVMGVTHEINQRMYSKSHFQHWVAENFPQHSPPTTPMLLNGSGNVIEAESFEDIVALEDKLRTLVAKGEIPVPFILKPVEGSGKCLSVCFSQVQAEISSLRADHSSLRIPRAFTMRQIKTTNEGNEITRLLTID